MKTAIFQICYFYMVSMVWGTHSLWQISSFPMLWNTCMRYFKPLCDISYLWQNLEFDHRQLNEVQNTFPNQNFHFWITDQPTNQTNKPLTNDTYSIITNFPRSLSCCFPFVVIKKTIKWQKCSIFNSILNWQNILRKYKSNETDE